MSLTPLKSLVTFQDVDLEIAKLLYDGKSIEQVSEATSTTKIRVKNVKNSAEFVAWQASRAFSRVTSEGVKIATETLMDAASNKDLKDVDRISASGKILRFVTDMSKHIETTSHKNPSEMSLDELEARLNELRVETQGRNKKARNSKPQSVVEDVKCVEVSVDKALADMIE